MELPQVFRRAMAVRAGWSPEGVDREVRSGRWTPLRRATYVRSEDLPPDGPVRIALEVVAAALATQCEVVGSQETAATIHGLPLFQVHEGPLMLSRHREPRHLRPGHASPAPLVSQLPSHHRTTVHGAVITSRARTAVDLARKGPALSALVVLDATSAAGVTRGELEDVLAYCRGWPGSLRAKEWLAVADGRAESPLESVGRWRMHQAELPPPDLQVVVRDLHGVIGRTDFCWEDLRTIGEADGFAKYRASDGSADFATLRAEKMREDRLRDAGWEVFRFTWDEAVHRPAVLEMRARRAFARGAARQVHAAGRAATADVLRSYGV